jgi:hypothetical protein
LPEGLKYQADMFTADEERQPGPHIEKLPLQEVSRNFADEN